MVKQDVPLQPMDVHSGAEIPLQPLEIPLQPLEELTLEQVDAAGGCDPMGSLCWTKLPVGLGPLEEEPMLE